MTPPSPPLPPLRSRTMKHDLFGLDRALTPAERKKLKRRAPIPHGHAAIPGTGPEGETCRTCRHLERREFAKTYLKCGLMKAYWTGGGGSDVRAKDPACKRWEPRPSPSSMEAPAHEGQ